MNLDEYELLGILYCGADEEFSSWLVGINCKQVF